MTFEQYRFLWHSSSFAMAAVTSFSLVAVETVESLSVVTLQIVVSLRLVMERLEVLSWPYGGDVKADGADVVPSRVALRRVRLCL